MDKRKLAKSLAAFARAKGLTPDEVGAPVDEHSILTLLESPSESHAPMTHGTPAEIVAAEIAAGAAATIPQGLLTLAGLTRDGQDAAAYELERATVSAGIPEEFRLVTPDTTRNALLCATEPRGVWMCGDVGRGKTTTACAILRGYLLEHRGANVLFATEDSLLGAMKSAMNAPSVDTEAVLARYIACDVLVLDDLGKARLSVWGVSQIFRVVDGRWKAHKPTIYTSQTKLSEWAALMEEGSATTARAMASRIAGSCDQTVFEGKDLRIDNK